MTTPAYEEQSEPFGQHGVRRLLRPVIVGTCAIALAVSAAMWSRSQHNYDSLWRVTDDRGIEISSVLGRLVITIRGLGRTGTSQASPWTYESQEFTTMPDGWPPSIWRTIGIDWGYEQMFVNPRRGTTAYWRFRLAWRTACIASALPLAIDAILRRRARRRGAAGFSVVPDGR